MRTRTRGISSLFLIQPSPARRPDVVIGSTFPHSEDSPSGPSPSFNFSRSTAPLSSRSISHATYAEKEFLKPRVLAFDFPRSYIFCDILTVAFFRSSAINFSRLHAALVSANQPLDVVTKGGELVLPLPRYGHFPKLWRHADGGSDGLFTVTFCSHFIPSMTNRGMRARVFYNPKPAWMLGRSPFGKKDVAFLVKSSYLFITDMKADPTAPKPQTNGTVVKKTISMPTSVFKKGARNAAKKARSFSNYIATLIDADRP